MGCNIFTVCLLLSNYVQQGAFFQPSFIRLVLFLKLCAFPRKLDNYKQQQSCTSYWKKVVNYNYYYSCLKHIQLDYLITPDEK